MIIVIWCPRKWCPKWCPSCLLSDITVMSNGCSDLVTRPFSPSFLASTYFRTKIAIIIVTKIRNLRYHVFSLIHSNNSMYAIPCRTFYVSL